MIPMRVGRKPRKNPNTPSFSMILRAMARGCPAAAAIPPCAAADVDDDWSCVLTTSSGLVMHDAIVPATPPEKRL